MELSAIIGRTTKQLANGVIQQGFSGLVGGSPKDHLRWARELIDSVLNDAFIASFVVTEATRNVMVDLASGTENIYA